MILLEDVLSEPWPTGQVSLKSYLPSKKIRELNQRRRRRLRKRHLKSEFALPQTLSRSFHLVQFVNSCQTFLELNSKGLYQSSGKEKESCCLVFPSSTKREIRHFHVVVVQRRLRNVQKSVMHVQSCCSANLCFFLPLSLPSPSSLLKLPIYLCRTGFVSSSVSASCPPKYFNDEPGIVPCEGIQDSLGFWIQLRGFRIPGTAFHIFFRGTWIPDSNR